MKKITRLLTFTAVVAVLLLLLNTIVAIDFTHSFDDPSGDVSDPDVDIVHVESESNDDQVIFTLKVAGSILDTESDDYGYMIYTYQEQDKTANQYILVAFTEGNATYFSYFSGGFSGGEAESTVSGDTLEMRVPKTVFSSMDSFYLGAMAGKGEEDDDFAVVDWVYSWLTDDDGSNGDDGTDGTDGEDGADGNGEDGDDTPGFSVILLIIAVFLSVIYMHKKNQR